MLHPQSIVHSLVEFADGSFKAQVGLPDMRLPIQYALTYPDRLPSPARHAPPEEWGRLEFAALDPMRYPGYAIVREAAEAAGNRGAIVNAADEVAVAAFLAGRLPFTGIATSIGDAVTRWGDDAEPTAEEIAALDADVRLEMQARFGLRDA